MESTSAFNWSVISLTDAHLAPLVDHYMQLSQDDLRLRFFVGSPSSPDRRREWTTSLVTDMFKRKTSRQLGVVDPANGNALIGVASWGPCSKDPKIADFGVSVVPAWRGKGLTEALMDQACVDAFQNGCTTMRVEYLYDNAAVQNLLRRMHDVVPLKWGLHATTASLKPYEEEVGRQLTLLAALLEAVDLSGTPAKL